MLTEKEGCRISEVDDALFFPVFMMSMQELHELVRQLLTRHKETKGRDQMNLAESWQIPATLAKVSASVSLASATSAGTPNTIDIDDLPRIMSRIEMRTTLMIKRIPRKYTLALLRQEIDSVLRETGLYDLLYLPVDSAKMTNRGYAFINFASPEGVGKFVSAFVGRPWNELNKRHKLAVICWANVQGKESTLAHIKTEER